MRQVKAGKRLKVTYPTSPEEFFDVVSEIDTLADRWIANHVNRFDPLAWDDEDDRHFRRKAFSELCLYLYVRDGHRGGDVNYADRVVKRINDPRYYRLPIRHPREFLLYYAAFLYANETGVLDADAKTVPERVLEQPAVWSVELPPFRLLELWFFCCAYGYETDRLNPDAVIATSCLNRQFDVVNSIDQDAYALTHNVFYYRNFGIPHPAFSSDPAPYDLRTTLIALILRYLAEGNTDVVLELLVAGVLQDQLPREIEYLALSWVYVRSDSLGFVPGPEFRQAHRDVTGPDDADVVVDNYHSTFVAAIATTVVRQHVKVDRTADFPLDDRTVTGLLELGGALHELSEYNLRRGASLLSNAAGRSLGGVYGEIIGLAVEYLLSQNVNGQFGVFTDEEYLYLAAGGDSDQFSREMVCPVTEGCQEVVQDLGPGEEQQS